MPDRRQFLALAALGGAAGLLRPSVAGAAPRSRLIDDRWTRHGSAGDPDHGAWGAFLGRHLRTGTASGVALLDYAGARADRSALQGYIKAMQAVTPSALSPDAAMAYWINVYNAVTIDLVVEAYPVDSIREVRGGLFNTGPWGDEIFRVDGHDLSLDDIEHGILRPVWRDARIHYAVNCASIGCPDLASKPYTSGALEQMLEAGARRYVNHPRGATGTPDGLVVSSIYDWFEEDFEDEQGVIRHLAAYATGETAAAVAAATEIEDYRYDWALNDTAAVS
ncbi:MAG: DUF547 domain-containing protein [Pseudomonadota bacterium]